MTGAPGIARAVRRRKFSEAYRHTHVYAWRRVFKAARNLRRAILDVLLSRVEVRRAPGEFPYKCHLCGFNIEGVDDRIEWHGVGNCVDICDDCLATGLDESQPDPEAANLPCPACKGRGWFPMPPADARPVLKFPDRPLIPRRDAEFGE